MTDDCPPIEYFGMNSTVGRTLMGSFLYPTKDELSDVRRKLKGFSEYPDDGRKSDVKRISGSFAPRNGLMSDV